MKVKTFFALIAAKNLKAVQEIRDQYINIISQPEANRILRTCSKKDVVSYLSSEGISLNEEQYRRIRALALLQLSTTEAALARDASKEDKNDQGDKMLSFLSNISPSN